MSESENPHFNTHDEESSEILEKNVKKLNLAVEFDDGSSVEIPYTEKRVSFPDRLIRETGGVKGYIRKEIEWGDYSRVLGSIINFDDLKKFSLLDTETRSFLYKGSSQSSDEGEEILEQNRQEIRTTSEINSIQSLRHFQRMTTYAEEILLGNAYGYDREVTAKFKEKLGENKWDELARAISKADSLLRKVIDALGDDFMDKTNVHAMQGVWSLPQKEAGEAFKQKMLLQSIFDPMEIERMYKDGESRALGYEVYSIQEPGGTLNENIELPEVAKNQADYMGQLKEKSVFLLASRGLSVSSRGFWSCDGRDDSRLSRYCAHPFFGFGKGNAAYVQYLRTCLGVIETIKSHTPKYDGTYPNPQWEKLNVYTQSIRDIMTRGYSKASGGESPHPMIPIVIGHPDIPELKWCHASYAYIPTKNGMSICKMVTEEREPEK